MKPQAPQWSEAHPFHWLLAAESGDRQAMLQLGIVYDCADDQPRAEAWYRQAADAGDPQARERLDAMHRQQAAALWKTLPQGDITPAQYDQILDLCNQVIALDPNHADVYWSRGRIFDARQEPPQAEADYRKVIELTPRFAGAHGRLGRLLITQGRFDEALPIAQKAHELNPKSYDWAVDLGHVYLLTGDRRTAREYYEKAIALLPDEDALTSGPLADFDLFIAKGWQVEACREEAAWFRKRFAEKQAGSR